MTWSLSRLMQIAAQRRSSSSRALRARQRTIRFETLESRTVMTALPYGALPDDTGEYMLGDVRVTVVLLESDPSRSPADNNPVPAGGIGAPAENWTSSSIAAIKSKVEQGMQWWEQTLDGVLAGTDAAGRDLLNFTYDWTFADTPVATGYEPIARTSNEFALWIYDFLNVVGFNQTGNYSSDVRAFNNFQRQSSDADWAFTIFVVNNELDADKVFASGGSFSKAFAFAGGRFMVVPADRPASSFAHEAGHMFWALDEYSGSGTSHLSRRGYYNTPNANHASNPGGDFEQQNSIMANGDLIDAAFTGHTTSQSSQEMIGWKDEDGDGLFDVLDVPFALDGIGRYDSSLGVYRFTGSTAVRTLANQNSSGLQNDITINRIRVAQVSIDDGPWTDVQSFAGRTYETDVDLSIPLSPGSHVIKIRTVDTRTGAMSPEFVGTTGEPESTPVYGGLSGFVYRDDNSNGTWDQGEPPLPDWAVDLVDENDEPIDLRRRIEPSQYVEGAALNSVHAEAMLSAVGGDTFNNSVVAKTTTKAPAAGKVFGVRSIVQGQVVDTWNSSRQLRIDFSTPVSSLSIRAYGGGVVPTMGRLEAYNSEGTLVGRYTTAALSSGAMERMSLSRAEGDIAYAIARGHNSAEGVVLDTLEWGPFASATTNTLGFYSIENVSAGSYRLKVNRPANHTVTTAAGDTIESTLAAGASGEANFGIGVSGAGWYNTLRPLNVNNDAEGRITAVDALIVIDWLNSHAGQSSQLPATATPEVNGYLDVNNDGYCTSADALIVIDWLNLHMGESEGESLTAQASANGFVAPAGGVVPEGEELAGARSAAEYYARNPLHFLTIAGDDEECLHEDETGDHEHGDQQLGNHDSLLTSFPTSATTFIASPFSGFDSLSSSLLLTLDGVLVERDLPPIVEQNLENAATWIERHSDAIDRIGDRIEVSLELLGKRRDDLDDALESIADDISAAWAIHLDRLRNVARRG